MHHILHKKHGAGLIEDLQKTDDNFKIDSMDTVDYFQKYLMEPEGLDRLLEAAKTIVKYECPPHQIIVQSVTIPYLTGVNRIAARYINDNINRIFIVFEKFPKGSASDAGANGHFELMWHFPISFNKKEHARNKFCFFDPFGRTRNKDDPEEYYFQKARQMDYQEPDSNTCALWVLFALIQYCLQISRIPGIEPVEYSGMEDELDNKPFQVAHARRFRENERALYRYFLQHWFIFNPKVQEQRPIM